MSEENFMKFAFEVALKNYKKGYLPIGACLIIDGKLIDVNSNKNEINLDRNSHAESVLIGKHSKLIKESKEKDKEIVIYTTLEPCLMCLSTAFFNRIDKIVYACPDPNGGATGINVKNLPVGYLERWPKFEKDIEFEKKSYDLLVRYMSENKPMWDDVLNLFKEIEVK